MKTVTDNYKSEKIKQLREHLRNNSDETLQAIEDARHQENLFGPYDSAEEAVKAMLEDY